MKQSRFPAEGRPQLLRRFRLAAAYLLKRPLDACAVLGLLGLGGVGGGVDVVALMRFLDPRPDPVSDALCAARSVTLPCATTVPPRLPAPGPMSMM